MSSVSERAFSKCKVVCYGVGVVMVCLCFLTDCYRKAIEGSMCTLLTRNAILVLGHLGALFSSQPVCFCSCNALTPEFQLFARFMRTHDCHVK